MQLTLYFYTMYILLAITLLRYNYFTMYIHVFK